MVVGLDCWGCGGFADLLTMWFSCLSMVRFGVCCLSYLDSAGGWLAVSCFGLWIVVCYCTVFYCVGLAFVMGFGGHFGISGLSLFVWLVLLWVWVLGG